MPSKGGKSRIDKQEVWRKSIKTNAILKKFMIQGLADFTNQFDDNGKLVPGGKRGILVDGNGEVLIKDIVPMTSSQIRINEVLLNRTLPAIKVIEQSVDLSGLAALAIVAPDTLPPEEWDKLAASAASKV